MIDIRDCWECASTYTLTSPQSIISHAACTQTHNTTWPRSCTYPWTKAQAHDRDAQRGPLGLGERNVTLPPIVDLRVGRAAAIFPLCPRRVGSDWSGCPWAAELAPLYADLGFAGPTTTTAAATIVVTARGLTTDKRDGSGGGALILAAGAREYHPAFR